MSKKQWNKQNRGIHCKKKKKLNVHSTKNKVLMDEKLNWK